jgi:hypothetical protein
MKFDREITKVLMSRKADSDMINVAEALKCDPSNIQLAFDVALAMENENLVKLIYSNFNAGKVVVELTLPGKAKSRTL